MHSAFHRLAVPYTTSRDLWQLFFFTPCPGMRVGKIALHANSPGCKEPQAEASRWLALFLPLSLRTPDPESIKNKEVTHMTFHASKYDSNRQTNARCVMCGAGVVAQGNRRLDLLCLICRAAILDRVFRARRQQTRAA
jgi:hypothetical protein